MSAAIGVGGLVITGTSTCASISDARGRRFLSRAKGLLELRDIITAEGPFHGPQASKNADNAHAELVSELEQGSRANTVLYLQATSRLAKPGSLIVGVGEIAYAVILVCFAFGGFPWSSSTADVHSISAIIVSALFVVIALIVGGIGVHQIVRRFETRRLRKQVGIVDDLTIEGSTWIKNIPSAMARKLRKK